MTTILAPRLKMELNAERAFSLTTQDKADVGYILAWSFDSGTDLKPDLSLPDPDSPDKKKPVVAILGIPNRDEVENQFWQGGRTDPADHWMLVSFENRAKLLNVMQAPAGGTEQKLSMRILRYDEDGKAYFECYAYEDLPAIFTPGFQCDVKSQAFTKHQPPTYLCHISFSPKGNAPEHEIRCAESPTNKVVAPWGGVGA